MKPGIEKRGHLADRQLQAAVHAVDLRLTAPSPKGRWRMVLRQVPLGPLPDPEEAEKAVALNPPIIRLAWDRSGVFRLLDEGTAFRKGDQADGARGFAFLVVGAGRSGTVPGNIRKATAPFSIPTWNGTALASRSRLYSAVPRTYRRGQAHVTTLLKMHPTMSVAEDGFFYELLCFEPAFREKRMARGLSRKARSN